MQFIKLETNQWERKEHYEHYRKYVPCAFSVTVAIDITNLYKALKAEGLKGYPAHIYMLAAAVNQFPEFRMSVDAHGNPGFWERLDPVYTVLNQDTKTFSALCTEYNHSFRGFYAAYLADTARYGCGRLFPQPHLPPYVFHISSLPWLDFTSFHLQAFSGEDHLLPIFTLGRYTKRAGKVTLPLAIQCHHAACDGLHVGRLVETVGRMAEHPAPWLLQ